MFVNFKEAFSFMFKENDWCIKLLIGSLLFFFMKILELLIELPTTEKIQSALFTLFMENTFTIVLAMIFLFLTVIFLFATFWMCAISFGYLLNVIGNYMTQEKNILPDWDCNILKYFQNGVKYVVASFIASFLFVALRYVLFFNVDNIVIGFSYLNLLIYFIATFIIVYIIFSIPALLLSFCEHYRFLSFFNFVRSRQIILSSIWNYFLTFLTIFVLMLVGTIATEIFLGVKIGLIIMPVLWFYLFLVMGNVLAQYYKKYCKIENK